MARTLWNRNVDYNEEEKQYYKETYGEGADEAFEYSTKLVEKFSLIYRYYKDAEGTRDEQKTFALDVENIVNDFKPVIEKYFSAKLPRAQHISWESLGMYTEYIIELVRAFCAKYIGEDEKSVENQEKFNRICESIGAVYGKYFNIYYSKYSVNHYLNEIAKDGAKAIIF